MKLKKKKNIISTEEYNKEVKKLNSQLAKFTKEKNEMVKSFNLKKNTELQILFKKINPIIENYMKENSVEILFNSKNIFMGSKNSDITQTLINEINNTINNQ